MEWVVDSHQSRLPVHWKEKWRISWMFDDTSCKKCLEKFIQLPMPRTPNELIHDHHMHTIRKTHYDDKIEQITDLLSLYMSHGSFIAFRSICARYQSVCRSLVRHIIRAKFMQIVWARLNSSHSWDASNFPFERHCITYLHRTAYYLHALHTSLLS